MLECQHNRTVLEGCPDCYHNIPNRAIHDDVCEITRAILGATNSGPDRVPGTPLFKRVEKTDDEILMALDEIILISEQAKDYVI